MTKPVLPMTGGCQCGAIRYESASFPLLPCTCNCTDCQRQTGSASALNKAGTVWGILVSWRVSRMLASHFAWRYAGHLAVLRRLRHTPLWRTAARRFDPPFSSRMAPTRLKFLPLRK